MCTVLLGDSDAKSSDGWASLTLGNETPLPGSLCTDKCQRFTFTFSSLLAQLKYFSDPK